MTLPPTPPQGLRRRDALLATLAGVAGIAAPTAAFASDAHWPNRPLRLVVPFPPGGGSDAVARILSNELAERLGQPVVIDNKPGGAGTVGVSYALNQPADGYTLIWCTPAAQYLAPRSVRYDPMADFAPVSQTVAATYILLVDPKLNVRSVADLVALAKAKPGTINYATAGIGGQGHLMGAYFNQLAGTDMTMVPFTGEGPALVGVIGSQVHATFVSSAAALPQVQSGKLRAIGMSSAKRLPGIPEDIAPIAATLAGYDVTAINYVAMRAGTPKAIVDRMSKLVNEALEVPAVRERIAAVGVVPVGSTPDALGRMVAAERSKWAEIMRKANIVLE
ncbi:Bug family tripartite tricarboxylate transporter substrate binding protein [Hydrogenophaga sp. BPS33]|uniref:Bug family tripartite tricarboxylate transporter substrate binding protein n=1 Tax=Hydrogenophaga sp. BPS33 TaxID=2651974 RepID=UPI00131F65FD|nr:tripartite tricarboxylate transporter substrate-binding protein [Hydrogenophaga sp. BPS33]QHE84475.1 tripartite tricarboxylate transporter substrate binding protein [Hydrogenophaga sp. BPS33]